MSFMCDVVWYLCGESLSVYSLCMVYALLVCACYMYFVYGMCVVHM